MYCAEAFGGVRVWDVAAGKLLRAHPAASAAAESFTIDRLLHSIGLSADGRTLASCASSVNNEYTDPVRLWEARDGTLRRTFADENIHGRPMALSPDGAVIATGGKTVRLWDAGSGELLRELRGLLKRTQSICFSADGRLVVAGGSYGTTNVWEAATGRHLVTLFAFPGEGGAADEWLAYRLDGSYDGSENVGRFLAWRTGDELKTFDEAGRGFGRREPERVRAALNLPGKERD